MCGISGIVQRELRWQRGEVAAHLKAMAQAIAHRGPDGEGVWVSEDASVGFAHRRLSIIDLSDAGAQPMWSHDRRYCVTFNGEIYNYLELRRELAAQGVTFRTDTDTEVLIEAYRAYGVRALEMFDGMYAFAIYDGREGEIFLARDPFGEKPLYYAETPYTFSFGSELDALRVIPGFDDAIGTEELAKFLCLQYFDGTSTIFRGARKLKPGHYARLVRGKALQIGRYFEFSPSPEATSNRSIDDWADELEDILVTNLKRRLRADVPVGAFLSGGVDSSTVVALAARRLGVPIQTYTIGFDNFDASEHEQAAMLASYFGVPHSACMLGGEALELGERIASLVDEPNGDTSLVPTYLLSEFARRDVKVALSGDGADEMFGGYGRYMQTLAEERLVGVATSSGARYYSNRILVHTEHEAARLIAGNTSGLPDFLESLRNEIDNGSGDLLARLRKTDVEHYLPGAVLAKVDRMSMRHGLEVRTPFLNIYMARFAERVPTEYLVNGDAGKLLLKRVAARFFPREWLVRPKRGFGLPPYGWAGKGLQQATRSRFVTHRDRNVWWTHREGISAYLDSMQAHNDNNEYKLWLLLHVQRYFTAKGGVPSAALDPMKLILLRRSLTGVGRAIGFARRPVPGWRQLVPGIASIAVLWGDTEEAPSTDWLRDPKSALVSPKCREAANAVAILDGGGSDAEMEASLRSGGIRWLLSYDGGQWHRRSLSGEHSDPHPVVPLFFSATESRAYRFRRREVIGDLVNQLPGLRHFSRAKTKAGRLFSQRVGLFRANTPIRAYRLFKELTEWRCARKQEVQARRDLLTLSTLSEQAYNPVIGRIALVISDLGSGGAERQLCNLTVGLKHVGFEVRVYTLHRLQGSAAHYLPILESAGVQVDAGKSLDEHFLAVAGESASVRKTLGLFARLPPHIQTFVLPLYAKFVLWRPAVMISFLDHPNLMAGLSALLAGIPKIVLSFRNHHPENFEFYEPWFRVYYKTLIASNRVTLTGNSAAGNQSYADWLGVPRSNVKVIKNGIDFTKFTIPPDARIAELKRQLGFAGCRIVVGIFRLASEKRPALFVKVMEIVCRNDPNARAVIVGEGPERQNIQKLIELNGLADKVSLVGRTRDVATYIAAANVLLQTAWLEGTPNSILEAQFLKKPVVTTAAGGAVEAAEDQESGLVLHTNDPKPLAKAVLDLLGEEERAKMMGVRGHEFVQRYFSVASMVSNYQEIIESACGGRIETESAKG